MTDSEVQHFYESEGKLFPAAEVHHAITRIFEGITASIITTSRSPKSVILRLAQMKKDPTIRARVWREAINDLTVKSLTVNPQEIVGKFHVTKIDFAKVKLDNTQ